MRPNTLPIRGLSQDSTVFCYSDLSRGNFIMDEQDRITVVDFAELGIVPLSFAKYVLLVCGFDGLGPSIRPWITFPDTSDYMANVYVLVDLSVPTLQGNGSFGLIGLQVSNGDNFHGDES